MGMEDDTRAFLILIVNSISRVLLWMMLCVFFGIYLDYGFFEDTPTWKNMIFYVCMLTSLFFLLRHLKRKWKI